MSAKIYAQVTGYAATPTMPDGSLNFLVEWKRLAGTRVGGKSALTIANVDRGLANDLREALADDLSVRFAPEVIRARDIVLLG